MISFPLTLIVRDDWGHLFDLVRGTPMWDIMIDQGSGGDDEMPTGDVRWTPEAPVPLKDVLDLIPRLTSYGEVMLVFGAPADAVEGTVVLLSPMVGAEGVFVTVNEAAVNAALAGRITEALKALGPTARPA